MIFVIGRVASVCQIIRYQHINSFKNAIEKVSCKITIQRMTGYVTSLSRVWHCMRKCNWLLVRLTNQF